MDALAGATVLDFTSHIVGPYATKLLADLGARVIKVERPGGECARSLGPWLGDEPGIERSATYQFLNTNKESVVIDLKRPDAGPVVDALVRMADLVVTGFAPAQLEELNLGYERLRAVKDVPVLQVTNFGSSGPYRDYHLTDTVLYAMGAEMFSHGLAGQEPLKLGGTAALIQAGAMGAVAAMGALTGYEVHDTGQLVELSLFDVHINNVDRRSSAILGFRFSGRTNERPPAPGGGLAGGIYPCADGFVEVTAAAANYWPRFMRMVGDPLFDDPKWLNPAVAAQPGVKEEVDAVVYPWMLSHTRAEIWESARREHALVAPLFTGTDLFEDAVYRARGLWAEVEHETLGRFPMLGRPYQLEVTPWRVRRAAPTLGQDTRLVLGEAGLAAGEIERLFAQAVVA